MGFKLGDHWNFSNNDEVEIDPCGHGDWKPGIIKGIAVRQILDFYIVQVAERYESCSFDCICVPESLIRRKEK